MIIVWDSYKAVPVKTIYQPHPNGVQSLDISEDAQLIVSVSYSFEEKGKQQVCLWNWVSEMEGPVSSAAIKESDYQVSFLDYKSMNYFIVSRSF